MMPVPFMANTVADRDVLLGQAGVAEAFALADDCDLMLVGIGTADPRRHRWSTTGMIDAGEVAAIRKPAASARCSATSSTPRAARSRTTLTAAHRHAAARAAARPADRRLRRRDDEGRRRSARCSRAAS